MMYVFYYVMLSIVAVYALFVLYAAVMNIKRVRDRGELTKFAFALGYPTLILGLVVDTFVNWFVFTLLFLELPREGTVTARLQRLKYTATGWRLNLAKWFEVQIDPFEDRPGGHIR